MLARFYSVVDRLRFAWTRQGLDEETRREFDAHLELLVDQFRREGMSPGHARVAARRQFGNVTLMQEGVYETSGVRWIDELTRDVHYAVRALRHSPAFTVVAVITLALGIGANTAIFSVVNAVILRPLPYPEPERLVSVTSVLNGAQFPVSPVDLMDWRRDARSFSGLAAGYASETILTGSGDAEQFSQARVTANAFDVLAVRPVAGRAFVAGEDVVSAPRIAILSERVWRTRFGSDSTIIGRSLTLDGFPTEVIGVAPASMQWPEPVDIWLTTRFSDRNLAESSRGSRYVTVVARLAPHATLETAGAEMNGIARRFEQLYVEHNAGVGTRLTPLLTSMVGDVRKPLFVLLGAVGFVLLIACANVGGLALGRIAARDSELALRTALGASRGRIARQLLTESVMLALIGGLLGLALGVAGIEALVAIAPAHVPRMDEVALDGRVLAFTFGVTALTALLFGMGPAARGTTADLHERLRAAGRGAHGRRSSAPARRALVVAEVTLAIVLLAGAGLLLRTLGSLYDVDPGFRAEGVSTFSTGQLPRTYSTKEREVEFTRQLLEGIRRLPGVTAADVSFNLPLSGSTQLTFTVRGGPPPDPRNEPRAQARSAGPQYFAAMGIPLIRGRLFDERDRGGPAGDAPQVLVISQELARRFFPGEDPLGKYLETGWSGPGWPGSRFGGEVIGIVGDVRQRGLDQGVLPHMYMSYEQWPVNEYAVVMRSTTPSFAVLSGARSLLKQLDPNIPMNDARAFSDDVDASLGDRRFYLTLLAIFAGVALALAVVGVYGVIAYGVQLRRREIGIRLALGATRERVLAMILSDGMRMVVAGVLLGVITAMALTRLLETLLFGVSPRDPVTFAAVPAVLIVAAALACLLPARRAARVNPVEAMRAE
jgi:putative ABC transport system permease protein